MSRVAGWLFEAREAVAVAASPFSYGIQRDQVTILKQNGFVCGASSGAWANIPVLRHRRPGTVSQISNNVSLSLWPTGFPPGWGMAFPCHGNGDRSHLVSSTVYKMGTLSRVWTGLSLDI